VFRSQIIAVLSKDPVTTFLLSFVRATQDIYAVCPFKPNIFYPAFISHIIAVLSNEPVTTFKLSYEMTTDDIYSE
jgi:hypothetical protein